MYIFFFSHFSFLRILLFSLVLEQLSKIGRKLQQSIEARASGAGGKPSGGSKSSRARAPPPPPKKQIDRNGTVVNHAPTAAGPKTSPAARITGSTSRRSNRIASVIPEGLIPSYNYEDDGEDDFNRGPTAAASSSSEEVKPKKGITFNTKIRTAKYVSSAVDLASCPPARPDMPEFAVIGRSNVGKSSLINFLTGVNDLAKVSKTPGKTRTINHFVINDDWYLVDLPGYGYAKMSSEKVLEWNRFTSTFFKERPTLANVFLLVDSSIPPQQLDLDVANWFGESQIPFSIVFTKMDKKKKASLGERNASGGVFFTSLTLSLTLDFVGPILSSCNDMSIPFIVFRRRAR